MQMPPLETKREHLPDVVGEVIKVPHEFVLKSNKQSLPDPSVTAYRGRAPVVEGILPCGLHIGDTHFVRRLKVIFNVEHQRCEKTFHSVEENVKK